MKSPEEIHNVRNSQLSIARVYGGITYNGHHYHYDASRDALIRQDIWLARMKSAHADGKAARAAEKAKGLALQGGLF